MVNKVDVKELSQSVDALIQKYGKLSGSASAAAKAKLLGRATELRESLEKASRELPPAVERGFEATKEVATAAKSAFVSDVVPIAISALATALDVISEKSSQAKSALSERAEVMVEKVAPPKKKSKSWIAFVAAPVVAAAVAGVAFSLLRPNDENWIPVDETKLKSEDSSDS